MTNPNENLTIEIDGERIEVAAFENGQQQAIESKLSFSKQGKGLYLIENGSTKHRITVVDFDLAARTCTIEMDGQQKQIRILREIDLLIEKLGLNAGHARKQSLMKAPMPGLVTVIKVGKGDHVEKGTPLLILEAMKMENVIASPHDAVIKTINVSVGQAVERGFPLLEFEV